MIRPEHISIIRNGIDLSRVQISSSKQKIRENYGWSPEEVVVLLQYQSMKLWI